MRVGQIVWFWPLLCVSTLLSTIYFILWGLMDIALSLSLSLAFQASAQNYMHALALLVSPQAHSRIFFPFLYTISFSNHVLPPSNYNETEIV